MRHYCTYFDSGYLTRGLALHQSLRRWERDFVLWVLCLDDATFDILTRLALSDVRPVALATLEQADPEFAATKTTRSRIEYYFTASPCWPRYLLNRPAGPDLVTYLDADLYFFSSPQAIFDELGDGSILLASHRFPDRLREMEQYGVYNVGLLSFRRDPQGLACLDRWRAQCVDWCFDRLEQGRFADQKYLDDWPQTYSRAVVLQHSGCAVAPWNIETHPISRVASRLLVHRRDPLVFYHFHSLKEVHPDIYDPCLDVYQSALSTTLRKHVYLPYIGTLRRLASGRLSGRRAAWQRPLRECGRSSRSENLIERLERGELIRADLRGRIRQSISAIKKRAARFVR